jgi:hypothetical protein
LARGAAPPEPSAQHVLEFAHGLQLAVVVGSADRAGKPISGVAIGFYDVATGSKLDQNSIGTTTEGTAAQASQQELLRQVDLAERKARLALA